MKNFQNFYQYKNKYLKNKISYYLLFVIIIAKILFGFYLENSNPDFFYTTDSFEYINPAKSICESGKFNDINNEPEIKRTPGVSILLSPAICLDLNLRNYIFLLNLLMILLAAYFTNKIINLFGIKIKSSLVYFIFLIDPTLSKHQYNVLSDIIFMFWLTLALYFFINGLKKKISYSFFLGFFILTLSAFIRPISIYLPYYLFVFILIFFLTNSLFRKYFSYSLLVTILLGVTLHFSLTQLWSYRNFKATGINEFSYIKVLSNYYYITAGIIAKNQNREFIELSQELRSKTKNLSKKDLKYISNNEIKKAIINYPFETIVVGVEGALMTLFSPGTGQYARMFKISEKNIQLSKIFFHGFGFTWIIVMTLLSIYGFFKVDKNLLFLFLVLIFIYLLLASSGPMSYSRFRIPLIPIITVFICSGFQNLLKMKINYKS